MVLDDTPQGSTAFRGDGPPAPPAAAAASDPLGLKSMALLATAATNPRLRPVLVNSPRFPAVLDLLMVERHLDGASSVSVVCYRAAFLCAMLRDVARVGRQAGNTSIMSLLQFASPFIRVFLFHLSPCPRYSLSIFLNGLSVSLSRLLSVRRLCVSVSFFFLKTRAHRSASPIYLGTTKLSELSPSGAWGAQRCPGCRLRRGHGVAADKSRHCLETGGSRPAEADGPAAAVATSAWLR